MTGGREMFIDDAKLREELRAPFPKEQIGHKPKGGRQVDFVGHAAVTDRLNHVEPGWDYDVEPVTVIAGDGTPHVVAVFGTMRIGGVTRQETGGPESPSTYVQELKEAISDFIVRGAMRFGVGLDLWAREDLSANLSVDGDTAARRSDPADAAPDPMVGPSTDREPSGGSTGVPRQGADAGSEGTSGGSRFIGGREANALQKALGGKALQMAQAEYGREIFQLTDLTFDQARDLVAKKVAV